MYSIVLLATLTTVEQAPAHGWIKKYGYGACYGPCYGIGYTGWNGFGHAAGGWGLPYAGYYGGCPPYPVFSGSSLIPGTIPVPSSSTYAPMEEKKEEKAPKEKLDQKDAGGEKKDKDGSEGAKPGEKKEMTRARVIFELPEGARLYVDDHPIENAVQQRSFRTPPLQKGEHYYYELRAEVVVEGKRHVETRRVTLSAGDVIKADFSRLGTTADIASVRGQ